MQLKTLWQNEKAILKFATTFPKMLLMHVWKMYWNYGNMGKGLTVYNTHYLHRSLLKHLWKEKRI